MRIGILCPDYPPTRSGLADHTWLLAHHLRQERCGEVVVITSHLAGEAGCERTDGLKVLRIVNHWGTKGIRPLAKRIRGESLDWLIVQYVPHLYGRGGINLALPLLLLWLRLRGRRILLIIHELYVDFPPLLNRCDPEARGKRQEAGGRRHEIFSLLTSGFSFLEGRGFSCGKQMVGALVQRVMLRLLLLAARRAGVSTERWTKRLWISDFGFWGWVQVKIRNHPSGFLKQTRFFHLPSPSAIDPVTADREQVRASLGIEADEIALCFFGNFHPSKMRHRLIASLKALLSRGRRATLLVIGPEYEKLIRGVDEKLRSRIITTGYVDRESVSRYLQASDIFLLPTTDGVSTRRTSLMAALSHALPVVATDGSLTDEILRTSGALLLSPVEDADGFIANVLALADDADGRRQLGERGRKLYDENFAWPIVIGRILEAMKNTDYDL